MKYKIFTLAFFLSLAFASSAQYTINLVMNSRPPAVLSEWATKTGTITLIVTNQQPDAKQVKIRATITAADGSPVSQTDMALAKVMVFPTGNTVLSAATVFPLEIQKFTGSYEKSLSQTGKIQSGSYRLCVELDDASNLAPRTPSVCHSFFLAGAQLPLLMKPYDGEILDPKKAQTSITFRWTPLVPRPQGLVNYRLQVFEILPDQKPVQALRSNQPVLDMTVLSQTQYIWQPQLGLLGNAADSGSAAVQANRFIWTIQTLDDKREVITGDANAEGRSQPIEFSIGSAKMIENKEPSICYMVTSGTDGGLIEGDWQEILNSTPGGGHALFFWPMPCESQLAVKPAFNPKDLIPLKDAMSVKGNTFILNNDVPLNEASLKQLGLTSGVILKGKYPIISKGKSKTVNVNISGATAQSRGNGYVGHVTLLR